MRNIANVILTKYNYINKKSDSNDSILIKINGKFMPISGLSFYDFEIIMFLIIFFKIFHI